MNMIFNKQDSEPSLACEKGYFKFTDLKADTYTIVAKKKGYKKSKQKVNLGEKEEKEIVIKMKKSR